MLLWSYRFVTLVTANNSVGLFKISTMFLQWRRRQNFLSRLFTSTTTDDVTASWRAVPDRRGRFQPPPGVTPFQGTRRPRKQMGLGRSVRVNRLRCEDKAHELRANTVYTVSEDTLSLRTHTDSEDTLTVRTHTDSEDTLCEVHLSHWLMSEQLLADRSVWTTKLRIDSVNGSVFSEKC